MVPLNFCLGEASFKTLLILLESDPLRREVTDHFIRFFKMVQVNKVKIFLLNAYNSCKRHMLNVNLILCATRSI